MRAVVDRADRIEQGSSANRPGHRPNRDPGRFVPDDLTALNVDDPRVDAEVTVTDPVDERPEAGHKGREPRRDEFDLLDVADEYLLWTGALDEDWPGDRIDVRQIDHASVE